MQGNLVTRNAHMKYQSSRTRCSNFISKIKVFKKNRSNSKVKVTVLKFLVPSERSCNKIILLNIKALGLTILMILSRLKFSKNSSKSKVKVTGVKMLVPTERQLSQKYTCEISRLFHLLFKSY